MSEAAPMESLSCEERRERVDDDTLLARHVSRQHPLESKHSEAEVRAARMAQLQSLEQALANDAVESAQDGARHVLMDMDSVLFGLVESDLYTLVKGATCGADVRLDISEFTTFMRQHHVVPERAQETSLNAVYNKTSPKITDVFERNGWSVKRGNGVQHECGSWLEKELLAAQHNTATTPTTLVLIGGGEQTLLALQSSPLLTESRVRIEIWAWARAMHEGFLQLMRERPETVRVHALDSIAERIVCHRYHVNAHTIEVLAEQVMKNLFGLRLGKASDESHAEQKKEEEDESGQAVSTN